MSRILKSWASSVDENNVVTIGEPLRAKPEPLAPQFEVTDTDYTEIPQTQHKKEPAIDLAALKAEAEADKAQAVSAAKASVRAEIEAEVRAEARDVATANARAEADRILQTARMEAETIAEQVVASANDEAEAIRNQAQQEGYDMGLAKAQEQAEGIVAVANAELEAAQDHKKQTIANMEPQVIELILSILDNIIGAQREFNPELISLLIAQGIDSQTGAEEIAIHVSPDDYDNVSKDDILAGMETMAELSIVKDPTLSQGGCIINTPLGSVDCGIDTQYNGVKRNLQYILRNR